MNDRDSGSGVEEAGRYLSGEDVVLTDGGEPEEKYADGGTVEDGGGPMIDRRTAIAGGAGAALALLGVGAYSMTQSGGDAEAGGGSSDPEGETGYEETTTAQEEDTTSETTRDDSGIPEEFQKVVSGIGIKGHPPGYLAARKAYNNEEYEGRDYEWKGSLMRDILRDREPTTPYHVLTKNPFHLWADGEIYDFKNLKVTDPANSGKPYIKSGPAYLEIGWESSEGETVADVEGGIMATFELDSSSSYADYLPNSAYVFVAEIPDEWVMGVDSKLESEGFDFWGSYDEYLEEFDVKPWPKKSE